MNFVSLNLNILSFFVWCFFGLVFFFFFFERTFLFPQEGIVKKKSGRLS